MKKVISVILVIAMLLSFTACLGNTPEKALDTMLTAIKNGDTETLASLKIEEVTDITRQENMISIFSSLSWQIGETVKQDDDATVDVKITAKDMQTVFSEYMTQALSQIMQGTQITEEDASMMFLDVMEATEETVTFDVVVEMDYEDGKWVIDDDNEAFFNAITGGFIGIMSEYENVLG